MGEANENTLVDLEIDVRSRPPAVKKLLRQPPLKPRPYIPPRPSRRIKNNDKTPRNLLQFDPLSDKALPRDSFPADGVRGNHSIIWKLSFGLKQFSCQKYIINCD